MNRLTAIFAALRPRFAGLLAALRTRPLVGALVLVPVAALMIGLPLGLTLWISTEDTSAADLARALELLDAGEHQAARSLIAQVRKKPQSTPQDQALPLFVVGTALAQEAAEVADPARRKLLHLVAARYLEEAVYRDLPRERERQAVRQNGVSLHAAGRYGQAAALLQQALALDPAAAPQLEPLLFDCYVRMQPPQPKEALAISERRMAQPALPTGERESLLVQRAELLLELGDLPAARTALSGVSSESPSFPQAEILSVRLDLAELAAPATAAERARTVCAADIERLRKLLGRSGLLEAQRVAALLLIGICYQRAGDDAAAIAQYDRVRRVYVGRPEAAVAGLQHAELTAPSDPAASLEIYRTLAREVGDRESYDNRWLPAAQLANRLEVVVQHLLRDQRHAVAAGIVDAFADFLGPAPHALQQAEVHRAWAEALLAETAAAPHRERELAQTEARTHFRTAAAADYRLAQARITSREYLGDLFRSAQTFLLGQNYARAAETFREYLRQANQLQRPDALVGLAEALLAKRQFAAALEQLDEALREHPRHPAVFRARLLAAQALIELDQLPAAAARLEENLYRSALSPNSREWRDSLFALGNLQYRQGLTAETNSRLAGAGDRDPARREAGLKQLEEARRLLLAAAETLGEAVARFPDADDALAARYHIAEAHRRSARYPRERLRDVIIQTTRVTLTRQQSADLETAVALYSEIVAQLTNQSEAQRRPVELKILRNAYFGRADALFDLARYEEAIQAYSAATNRYQHEPEALEAYVQIAACYRRLRKWNEARGTLEQARLVLARIRPEARFTAATRLDRNGWSQLLDWLSTL